MTTPTVGSVLYALFQDHLKAQKGLSNASVKSYRPAGHESPRTTKLYDRTKDEITLREVERIRL